MVEGKCGAVAQMTWTAVEDGLPTKKDGWIGYALNNLGEARHFIRVLAVESGGYGRRVRIREFRVLLVGRWTTDNSECEIATGSFMDGKYADWPVILWMPLPDLPELEK